MNTLFFSNISFNVAFDALLPLPPFGGNDVDNRLRARALDRRDGVMYGSRLSKSSSRKQECDLDLRTSVTDDVELANSCRRSIAGLPTDEGWFAVRSPLLAPEPLPVSSMMGLSNSCLRGVLDDRRGRQW